ncbi:Sensor protein CpxA [compost metagenome]
MVRRSLIVKIVLYSIFALFMTFFLAFHASRLLMSHGLGDAYRQVGADYAQYIAREVEDSFRAGQPDPARLADLQRSLHVDFLYVPAASDSAVPAELATQEWTSERLFGPKPIYWVRIDPDGQYQGALRIAYHPPTHAGATGAWLFAGFMVVTFGLMISPPLYLWVIRPLRRMVDTAHRLGRDLNTPVANRRKDEFGDLEEAFEAMRQRIQRMLAQKERLLTDISHEMRGPLSRMAIALPLVRADGETSPYLDHLERNMQAMDRLIGELLALSRGQTPPERYQEPLDLAEMAQDLLAERSLVLRQQEIAVETRFEPAPVTGDRLLIERALGNLLDNAIKYGKGPLRVETHGDGQLSQFQLSDRGPGIPEPDLPHLFEPFYRPDTSRSRLSGGTGLGLAIVRTVAQSHGGEASLASAVGEGTTANFRLPFRSP